MASHAGIRELSDSERLQEAGCLMQAELERLGLSEDELSADLKAWRLGRIEKGCRS